MQTIDFLPCWRKPRSLCISRTTEILSGKTCQRFESNPNRLLTLPLRSRIIQIPGRAGRSGLPLSARFFYTNFNCIISFPIACQSAVSGDAKIRPIFRPISTISCVCTHTGGRSFVFPVKTDRSSCQGWPKFNSGRRK